MRWLIILTSLICVVLLAACKTVPVVAKPTSSPTQNQQLTNAATTTNVANVVADQKLQEQAGKLRANVDAAKNEVDAMPVSNGQIIASGELELAQKRLGSVTPDAVEADAAKQRKALVETGKLEEARAAYDKAEASAMKLAQDLAKAMAERDAARASEEAARRSFLAQLEQNRISNQAALDAAHNEVLRDQVRSLNIAAASCIGLAMAAMGLGFVFGGIASIRAIGPAVAMLGVAGLMCFGLAQIVGQWWFKWAILIATSGIVTWVAVWAYRHYKQGNLKAEAEAKASQFNNVLQAVVPTLDKAYDNADNTIKTWIEQNIYQKLSKVMDSQDKRVIHLVRAENKAPTQ